MLCPSDLSGICPKFQINKLAAHPSDKQTALLSLSLDFDLDFLSDAPGPLIQAFISLNTMSGCSFSPFDEIICCWKSAFTTKKCASTMSNGVCISVLSVALVANIPLIYSAAPFFFFLNNEKQETG